MFGRQTFPVCPGPGQTGNVWRPNTIKSLSKRSTHARIKHVWYAAVQANKTSPIKHKDKRSVLSFRSNVWWPSNFIKHDQTRSDTMRQHQTRCPNGKMFCHQNNVWRCLVAKLFPFVQGSTPNLFSRPLVCMVTHCGLVWRLNGERNPFKSAVNSWYVLLK